MNFLFICESWKIKCITVSTQILCSTTVFNIDNNQKCFLSSKSAYYYDFWRSCDTEDWSNDAENTALITEINYSLTHIHIEISYLICNNISQFLLDFWRITCSLAEQKRLFKSLYRLLIIMMLVNHNFRISQQQLFLFIH